MEDGSPLLTPEELQAADGGRRSPKIQKKRPAAQEDEEKVPSCSDTRLRSSCTASFAEKYQKIEKVGVGAYGNVFMARNSETNQIVAIKATFRKEDPLLGGFPLSLLREIGILRRVKHDSIVQLYEVVQTQSGDPLIVMEFCQASLLELIHSQKHDLSCSEIKYIIRQVLDATGHLHEHGILHRDLATKNVLFNLSGEVKVCDFGISRLAFGNDEEFGYLSAKDLENPNQIVSLPYRAIELLLGEPNYTAALDIWAVGCILAEVLLCQSGRRQPFFSGDPDNPNKTQAMIVEEIFHILGRPTDETWPGVSALPLFKTYTSARATGATPHRAAGEERLFLKKFFVSGEGQPANTKYCLTESCFDLLGRLFALCPGQRATAAQALQHGFFTKEKPMPEWHAWHWALASSEIPRGQEMRRQAHDDGGTRTLLKQLSRDEVKSGDDGVSKPGMLASGKSKEVLESWRLEAEKRRKREEKKKQAGEKRSADGGRGTTAPLGEKLPPGWTKHWSSSKQKYYYHDSASGQNVWNVPVR